jgi:hypothetical protein
MNEIAELQRVLVLAKRGEAGLVRLAQAHEVACRRRLSHTIAELRRHIIRLVPNPDDRLAVGNSLLVGVISGVGTHFLLKAVDRR